MDKKRLNLLLFGALLVTCILVFGITPTYARKGCSKGKDVWWIKHVDENTDQYWKAIVYRTRRGIVHEWRYELNGNPIDVHLIYKPADKYPRGHHGRKWIHWNFDDRYEDLSGDEGDLIDYLTRYSDYWVHIN